MFMTKKGLKYLLAQEAVVREVRLDELKKELQALSRRVGSQSVTESLASYDRMIASMMGTAYPYPAETVITKIEKLSRRIDRLMDHLGLEEVQIEAQPSRTVVRKRKPRNDVVKREGSR